MNTFLFFRYGTRVLYFFLTQSKSKNIENRVQIRPILYCSQPIRLQIFFRVSNNEQLCVICFSFHDVLNFTINLDNSYQVIFLHDQKSQEKNLKGFQLLEITSDPGMSLLIQKQKNCQTDPMEKCLFKIKNKDAKTMPIACVNLLNVSNSTSFTRRTKSSIKFIHIDAF